MSYYKIIDGVRYDRKMLEVAEIALAAHPGNFIEVFDAVPIWEAAIDGKSITETEARTLEYLQKLYPWTESALAWLERQQAGINSSEFDAGIERIIREKYGIASMQWIIDEAEVEQQEQQFGGKVSFRKALDKLLESFLEDRDSVTGTVRQSVQEVHQLYPDTFPSRRAWSEALDRQLRVYLEDAYIFLVRYGASLQEGDEETREFTYELPPGGESLEENWILGMGMPTFSDHIFWGIVDRSGKKSAFHYEFN